MYSVNDRTSFSEVDWVNSFIVNVVLERIEIYRLASMSRVVKEQGIMGTRVIDKPMHSSKHICLGGNHCGIRRIIISKNNHIFMTEPVTFTEELGDIEYIIDTSVQLIFGSNVINSNQKSL